MLLVSCLLGLCLQGVEPVDQNLAGSLVITGSPELSREAARASARSHAKAQLNSNLQVAAVNYLQHNPQGYLPESRVSAVLEQWCWQETQQWQPTILKAQMEVRDHRFGQSYQEELLLKGIEAELPAALARLQGQMASARYWFFGKWGAVLMGLTATGVLGFWLDRMTRGYMTGRLALLFSGLAMAGSSIAFLL